MWWCRCRSSWLRKPLYRRCGNGERAATFGNGEGRNFRKWRGPQSMTWLVARREFPPSLFSFLHGRTWAAPCFITFLLLSVSSPLRQSIPSLLIQTCAQHLGDSLACFSSGFERLPREVAPSRGLFPLEAKSSRSVFLLKQNPREAFFFLARYISRSGICPLEVTSGTCLARQIACLERHPPEAFS